MACYNITPDNFILQYEKSVTNTHHSGAGLQNSPAVVEPSVQIAMVD